MATIERRTHPVIASLLLAAFLVTALVAGAEQDAEQGAEAPSAAPVTELGEPVEMDQAGRGELLLETEVEGAYLRAPTLETEVEIYAAGLVARTRVRQSFTNPTDFWVTGVYVFPLPDTAAVDHLQLIVGDRVIEGEIEEKEAAREQYEAARAAGQRAALLEQKRPDVFTTSVANLGPGEVLEVVIEYQQEVRYDAGVFSLRFPMVVAPRYRPGGTRAPAEAPLPEPEQLGPGSERGNPVRLTALIDAGLPLAVLDSPSHEVLVTPADSGGYRVELAARAVLADRDFELRWEPEMGQAPTASLFLENTDDATYALLMLLPPPPKAGAPRLARTVIFVIDTSASMSGASIHQAKESLIWAIGRLAPEDRFNVIRFSSYADRLFPAAVPADGAMRTEAIGWVRHLGASGGTDMLAALSSALDRPDAREGLTQVVFITDGEVDNESELFEFIRHSLGSARLFTVGIGSAPNAHFMRKAARHGRGTFTFIGRPSEVEARMALLFAKLESPVLSDIAINWLPGVAAPTGVEAWPGRVGDLYLGEPLQVAARLPPGGGPVEIEARFDRQAFGVRAEGKARSPGIAKLWAQRKIDGLLDRAPGAVADDVRAEVVRVALEHELVSKFTSLVAVDTQGALRDGPLPEPVLLPVHLPAGWTPPTGPSLLPRGATGMPRHLLLGALALLFAALLLPWATTRSGRAR